MTDTTEPTTALERFSSVVAKITEDSISFDDLVKEVAPPEERHVKSTKVSLPAQITEEQRVALERLEEVFGQVVPTERRALESVEVTALVDERLTLNKIEDMAKKRKGDIRTTILHHLDVEAEESGQADEDTSTDADGHYILKGNAEDPEHGKRFSREVRNNAPRLSAGAIEALLADEETLAELEAEGVTFTREDYLSMTRQVRVFDEEATMILLRKRPELVSVISRATKPGSRSASLHVRKL